MRVLFWGTPEFAAPPLRALLGEGFDVPERRPGPEELLALAEQRQHDGRDLAIGLALLPPRERRIIEARFLEKKTLAQVGVELRLTRERVRQLQKQALRFLRAWLGAPETTMRKTA